MAKVADHQRPYRVFASIVRPTTSNTIPTSAPKSESRPTKGAAEASPMLSAREETDAPEDEKQKGRQPQSLVGPRAGPQAKLHGGSGDRGRFHRFEFFEQGPAAHLPTLHDRGRHRKRIASSIP